MTKLLKLVFISTITYGAGRLLCNMFDHPTIMYVMGTVYGVLALPRGIN